tara:strand:- start:163 stop:1296 length:1134 start_codon:yes stop_codon:yes gene_type:complete
MALNTLPNAGLTNRGYPSDRIVTPLIINGDFTVAQRATSATGLTNGSSPYQTVDRWQFNESGAPSYQFTMSQSTTTPTGQGFGYSTKFDCTTAQGSLAAADFLAFRTALEGQNLQSIKKGTANAESLTLSFWVRSNKTGVYTIFLNETDNNRQNTQTYTIDSANTWEKKVISFVPDTTGVITNDNGSSLYLHFILAAGSTYSSGTFTSNTWAATTQANRVPNTQVNIADSTSNEWYVTGVQLEVGEFDSTSIPAFPFESFDNNLQKCMRYFERVSRDGNRAYGPIACGMQRTTTQSYGHVMCRILKRSSATSVSQSSIIATDRLTTDADVSGIGNISTDYQGVHMDFTHASFGAAHRPVLITGDNSSGGYVDIDSEL